MEVKTNNYKCIHTLSIKIKFSIHQMKRGDDIGKL